MLPVVVGVVGCVVDVVDRDPVGVSFPVDVLAVSVTVDVVVDDVLAVVVVELELEPDVLPLVVLVEFVVDCEPVDVYIPVDVPSVSSDVVVDDVLAVVLIDCVLESLKALVNSAFPLSEAPLEDD